MITNHFQRLKLTLFPVGGTLLLGNPIVMNNVGIQFPVGKVTQTSRWKEYETQLDSVTFMI